MAALWRFSLIGIREYIVLSWRTFASSGFMFFVLVVANPIESVFVDQPLPNLLLQAIFGASVYVLAHFLLWLLQGRPNGPEKYLISFFLRKKVFPDDS